MKAMVLTVWMLLIAVPTWAIPFETSGTEIMAIDGDADVGVTVTVYNIGDTSPYIAGYFLAGDPTFYTLGLANIFLGGSIIDLALYDFGSSTVYRASSDSMNPDLSVLFDFGSQVTTGSPELPAGFADPYYNTLSVTWNVLGHTAFTTEVTSNCVGCNDGLAPVGVPEPSTLLLLGSGLAAVGLWNRKRKASLR